MIGFNQKIKSTDNRNYLISSDLHFGHRKIMEFCKETRPWSSLEEMHESLIEHWNSKVSGDDVVFHLGDFSFFAKEKTQSIIDQLNGNVVWIAGNHDYRVFNQMNIEYHHYFEVSFDNIKICMSHYPIVRWNRQNYGAIHAHGHVHGNYQVEGRGWDVGWDNNGKILSLPELIDITNRKDIIDRHK